MLKQFVVVWLAYWAIIAVLPVHSLYPATTEAALLQFAFVILVITGYFSVAGIRGRNRMPEVGRYAIKSAPVLIGIAIGMSVIGLAALTYDKIFVQGIDYSEGIAFAREEWRRLGEERDGEASSIFSVLGYLFGSAYFVATVLTITQTPFLSPRQRLWSQIGSFALVIGNSWITGGRSNVLLLLAFVVASFSSRRGLSIKNFVRNARHRRVLKLLVLLGMAYAVFVFYQRAEAGDVAPLEYAIDFLPFLGVEADDWYRSLLGSDALSSLSAMIVLTFSYVTHSFATTAAIVDAPSEDKTIIFLHIATILSKLGLTQPPDGDWFLSGRLPTIPGSLLHQFGIVGFVLGSFLLGSVSAAAHWWTIHRPRRLLPLGAYVMMGTVLLLSPALFAGDFLSFPFVLGSFVQIALIGSMLRSSNRGHRLSKRATTAGQEQLKRREQSGRAQASAPRA